MLIVGVLAAFLVFLLITLRLRSLVESRRWERVRREGLARQERWQRSPQIQGLLREGPREDDLARTAFAWFRTHQGHRVSVTFRVWERQGGTDFAQMRASVGPMHCIEWVVEEPILSAPSDICDAKGRFKEGEISSPGWLYWQIPSIGKFEPMRASGSYRDIRAEPSCLEYRVGNGVLLGGAMDGCLTSAHSIDEVSYWQVTTFKCLQH